MKEISFIVSLLVLAVLALVFLYVYMASLRHHAEAAWSDLTEKLGVRLDKIPYLIETLRMFGAAAKAGSSTASDGKILALTESLILLKSKAWALSMIGRQRVHVELDVTAKLRALWTEGNRFPELVKSTNYLSLRSEFRDVAVEIEKVLEIFNGHVRHYNRMRNFVLFRPFVALMKFAKMPIFEFEKAS